MPPYRLTATERTILLAAANLCREKADAIRANFDALGSLEGFAGRSCSDAGSAVYRALTDLRDAKLVDDADADRSVPA